MTEPVWAAAAIRARTEQLIQELADKLPENAGPVKVEHALGEIENAYFEDIAQEVVDAVHDKKRVGDWLVTRTSTREVRCRWGKLRVPVTQYRHRVTGEYITRFDDDEIDSSGWLPQGLEFLLAMTTELPAGVAEGLCRQAGFNVSRAELERLVSDFGKVALKDRRALLEEQTFKPLKKATTPSGRVMVAQLDGCIVLGRPEDGQCPGVEVKSMVVYPEQAPQERVMHSDVCTAEEFRPACAGLLREAGVRENDVLVGLGDGAPWVAQTLRLMGAKVVLDVYHAADYVDVVMQELGWDEKVRADERRAWLHGECNGEDWLKTYLPTEEKWQKRSEAGCAAARYLLARREQMDYPSYRAQGWPIGSGQIEGANKSVIGHRDLARV